MTTKITNSNKGIIALSVLIPLIVATLFGIKIDATLPIFLPPIYASINALTAMVLIAAFWCVKKRKYTTHEKLMKLAIGLSVLFLLLYITYHITSNPTVYGGQGMLKPIYYFVLISHIVLSIVVIPLVLLTFVNGLQKNFLKHKKIARYAFPIWLYVTISGVAVYFMIAPYY